MRGAIAALATMGLACVSEPNELVSDASPIVDGAAADAPVNDAPVADAPVNDAPVNDAPVNDAPVNDATVESSLDLTVSTGCSSHVVIAPPGRACYGSCQESYAPQETVFLTPMAGPGETFDGFTGDCAGTDVCTTTMDQSRMVGASFTAASTETLQVTLAGSGAGRVVSTPPVIDCPGTCSTDVATGCGLELAAVSPPTARFTGWSGDCAGTDSCLLAMNAATEVTATFEHIAGFAWARRYAGFAEVIDLDVTSAGEIVLLGSFTGTIDLGGGPLQADGASGDVFVAKLSAQGDHLWSFRAGGVEDDWPSAVVVDAAGDVVVAATSRGVVDYGGGAMTSNGGRDAFFAKYAGADGAHEWSFHVGGPAHELASDVAVTANDDVVAVGRFRGTVDLGGGDVTSADLDDIFVARYAAGDGSHVWAETFGGLNNDTVFDVEVGSSDDVYLAGRVAHAVDFGGGLLTAGDSTAFLARFDAADGSHTWSRPLSPGEPVLVVSIAIDGARLVAGGSFEDTVDLGEGPVTAVSSRDAWVGAYDIADGAHDWVWTTGDTGHDLVRDVVTDGGGGVLVVGSFPVGFTAGPWMHESAGPDDAFALRLAAADGTPMLLMTLGGAGDDAAHAGWLATDGSFLLAGRVRYDVDFGGGVTPGADVEDAFIARYTP